MLTLAEIESAAHAVRQEFEQGTVNPQILADLYHAYNPLEDIDVFLQRARALFPALNCGIASVYLQYRLKTGAVLRGSYDGEPHTFLDLGEDKIADITADQYGGPVVYVGPLQSPWSVVDPSPAQTNTRS
jgi:hypothetical protein